MLTFRKFAHLVILISISLTAILPASTSSADTLGLNTKTTSGNRPNDLDHAGRSLLGALGSTLGGLLGTGGLIGGQPEEEEESEEEDEDEPATTAKPQKLKKRKKVPSEQQPRTGLLNDEETPEAAEVPKKKKIIKRKRTTTQAPRRRLKPKYADDDEELTETDKDFLSTLMVDAKAEQVIFEKELIAEILQHARETVEEGEATMASVSKKVQGYLMKLRDTAREKGEDLYDKTKQLFGVLLGHAKQEGPEMMKKVKVYVSKVLAAEGQNGEKGPLSDEDKAFLASLMAGVKWGDEEPGATTVPSTIPVITVAPYIPTGTLAPYVNSGTSVPFIPPVYIPPSNSDNSTANSTTNSTSAAPTPPPASGGSFEQEALDAHNQYRAKHGAPPLKLNPQLTSVAQAWASNIAGRGKMQHSTTDYGENIFFSGKPEVTSGKEPVDKWYGEIGDFNWNCLECTFEKTGHFSQVIWVDTKEVGIAKASGKTGTYVVANYNPAGNLEGTYLNNTLPIR